MGVIYSKTQRTAPPPAPVAKKAPPRAGKPSAESDSKTTNKKKDK